MAKKLTIVGLTNPTQLFGANFTPYAMFNAVCEGNSVEIGITHNSLSRAGYDTAPQSLSRLVGCQVVTKDFVDRNTGAIISGDERVEMVLNGEGRLVLFNTLNHTIEQSETYREETLDLLSRTDARVKIEKEREIMNQKRQAILKRLADASPVVASEAKAEEANETAEVELTLDEA